MDEPRSALWDMPPPVLYDVFAEAASRVVAAYSRLLDQAQSAGEREEIWVRIHQIRADRHAADPADRRRQIDLMEEWGAERRRLDEQAGG